ncbi:MAG: hypothetical protein J5I98_08195, partial [Phaeodactylibacter sp.]|nr:hypothetical protein [Phaeodactylibacter sp.]
NLNLNLNLNLTFKQNTAMNHTLASPPGRRLPFHALALLLLLLLTVAALYYNRPDPAPELAYFTGHTGGGSAFSYEVTTSDLAVDWPGDGVSEAERGGDFDPKDKCPEDFFAAGFTVIFKKLPDGNIIKFLYHKGKKLLYRIDKDAINGKAGIGLHRVTGTHFNAKYRIADKAFKGGKSVSVPNAKGGADKVRFRYGEAVSKRRVRPDRELFRETHIGPKQCQSWWDLFNFMP